MPRDNVVNIIAGLAAELAGVVVPLSNLLLNIKFLAI